MKHIKHIVASFLILCSLGVLAAPALSYADTAQQTACSALGSKTCDDKSGGLDINSLVTAIINIFSLVIGIVAVIMIMVGGFRYVTSAGDSNRVASAKNTIIYALVGLIIVALAQSIVRFVIYRATTPTPSCSSGQMLDSDTNTCIKKKKTGFVSLPAYKVADRYYTLNYQQS